MYGLAMRCLQNVSFLIVGRLSLLQQVIQSSASLGSDNRRAKAVYGVRLFNSDGINHAINVLPCLHTHPTWPTSA